MEGVSRRGQLLTIGVVALALVGAWTLWSLRSHEYDDWPFALQEARDDGNDAGFEGVLTWKGECLAVVMPHSEQTVMTVFPYPGTQWDRATETLAVGGQKFRPGDTIVLGGGEAGYLSLFKGPPSGCYFELFDSWNVRTPNSE